jgi:hypothetical protein
MYLTINTELLKCKRYQHSYRTILTMCYCSWTKKQLESLKLYFRIICPFSGFISHQSRVDNKSGKAILQMKLSQDNFIYH